MHANRTPATIASLPRHVGSGWTALRRERIRLGIVRLTDAAPVIIAKELGFFAKEGLDVEVRIEPSWANIADKLTYGHIDGAVALPALALAVTLGLRGHATPLVVPMSISLNGNTVTFSSDCAAAIKKDDDEITPAAAAARLRSLIAARRRAGDRPLRIAVVHAFSTHNLLLRYWLASGGIDPHSDVSLPIVPPAQMVEALRDGEIDGFCAGAPWGEIARRTGVGCSVVTSREIWNNHPEKVLALRRGFCEARPARADALLQALLRAARFCDASRNAPAIAEVLARDDCLAVHPDAIFAALPRPRPALAPNANRPVFFANAATFPWLSHAFWFLNETKRWGYIAAETPTTVATELYRPDLYRRAAMAIGISLPHTNLKPEGVHADPWRLSADPRPITMGADLFCDGAVFDPTELPDPALRVDVDVGSP